MKKVCAILGVAVASTLGVGGGGVVHSAEPSYYLGVSGGISKSNRDFGFINPRITTPASKDEDDRVTVVTFKVGKYLTNNIRTEIEYGHSKTLEYTAVFNPFTTFQQKVTTKSKRLMLNTAYDFKVTDAIKLFPMVGIGYARNVSDGFQIANFGAGNSNDFASKTTNNFAWSVGAGVSYDVSNTIVLDLGYQYLDLGGADTGTSEFGLRDETFTGDLTSQEIKVGIRYLF